MHTDGFKKLNNVKNEVELLKVLESGVNINVTDRNGNTVLKKHILNNDVDKVKLYLKHGINCHKKNYKNQCAVHYVMCVNYIENINFNDSSKMNMLKLISENVDNFNVRDKAGYSPISLALLYERDLFEKIIIFFKKNNIFIDFSIKDNNGNNLIHNAIIYKQTKYIDMLIKKDVNIEGLNDNNESPLDVAFNNSNEDAIKKLINLGANSTFYEKSLYDDNELDEPLTTLKFTIDCIMTYNEKKQMKKAMNETCKDNTKTFKI